MPPVTMPYNRVRDNWYATLETIGAPLDAEWAFLSRHDLFEGVRLLMVNDPRPGTSDCRVAKQGSSINVGWA